MPLLYPIKILIKKKKLWLNLFYPQDDAIHSTIRNIFANKFKPLLREGQLYSLSNFRVVEYKAKDNYWPIKKENKIIFLLTTFIKELEQTEITISRHKFDFVDYNTIVERIDNNVHLTGTFLTRNIVFFNMYLCPKILIRLYFMQTLLENWLLLEVWKTFMFKDLLCQWEI